MELPSDETPLKMSKPKITQMEHSMPSGAPLDNVAEGTIDEGTPDSKAAQASSKQITEVPETMAPAGLATNTAGELADPTQGADQATPHAELSDPLEKLEEHDF